MSQGKGQDAGVLTPEELLIALRARLPVCPFDPKAPKNDLGPTDPCPVCSDYGDERSQSLCRGADTRIMDQAADTIERLQAEITLLKSAKERT